MTTLPPSSPSSHPILRPLWTERSGMVAHLREELGHDLTLEEHERQVARFRRWIAAGGKAWPPRSGSELGLGATYPMPAEFRLTHPACWLSLPPVGSAMVRIVRGLLGAGHPKATVRQKLPQLFLDCYHTAMFLLYGSRVYYLDPVTAELLLETPLPRFPARDLHMPLPAFAVALPEGRFLATAEGDAVSQPVDGLFITVDSPDTEGERILHLMLTCRSPKGPADDNMVRTVTRFGPETRLDAIRIEGLGTQGALGDALLRLVLGLCLYLQSAHPRLTPVVPSPPTPIRTRNPKKRRRQEAAAAAVSALPYLWVGGGHASATPPEGQRSTETWRLDHQVWVAGHWRQQPYGAGNQLRKTIWIEPHRRGPDFAEAAHQRAVRVPSAEPAMHPPRQPAG